MKRMIRSAAMSLALACSISASIVFAGTNTANGAAESSAEELSQLAAELAETTAKLAKLQEAYSSAESNSDTKEAVTPVTEESKTTVHWLSSDSNQLTSDARIDIDIEPAMATDASGIEKVAPRPAATAYRDAPVALPSPTSSSVIRAQANEEVFYTARAGQDLDNAVQDDASWGDPAVGCTSGCDTCCDTCCDVCDDTCCSPGCGCAKCRRRRILVVGTEAVFLDADINGQRIQYRYDDFETPASTLFGPAYGDASIDDFYIAPRLWLGVQGECWGVVGRYFHMRVGEHDRDPLVPQGYYPEQSFDSNSIFEAYYTDIELTRNFCVHGCKSQLSFGARYALIEHNESIYARSDIWDNGGTVHTGLLTGYGRSNRQAHGTGLTFGLNGRKPLFCNSCAHWFYNVRSSILWGCNHSSVETEATAVALNGGTLIGGSIDTASVAVEDDLFIGEVQLGIEWDFALRCLPAKSFFRAAFEYQYWDASSGFAQSGSFAGLGNPAATDQVSVTASAPGLIVDLIGFSVGTGFTW